MDDAGLMSLIGRGDSDALRILIERHQKAVYNFFLRSTGSPEDAEDLTQQLFISIYMSAGKYCEKSSFRAFLYRIASNLAASHARKNRKGRFIPLEDGIENREGPDLASSDSNPLRDLANRELQEAYMEQLMKLPEEQRRIMDMRVAGGLSYREIADITGRTLSAVETAIFRARERIAAGMGRFRKT